MSVLQIVLIGITVVLFVKGISAIDKEDSKGNNKIGLIISVISLLITILSFTYPAPSVSELIKAIFHTPQKYDITYEGTVKEYSSYTDLQGHDHKDVIYMEYDGTESCIIIHTKGEYSRISFDFYAVEKMDPLDMAKLSFNSYYPPHDPHTYAAIPYYNPAGRFNEDVSESEEVRITFSNPGIPSKDSECAVIIENLKIQ